MQSKVDIFSVIWRSHRTHLLPPEGNVKTGLLHFWAVAGQPLRQWLPNREQSTAEHPAPKAPDCLGRPGNSTGPCFSLTVATVESQSRKTATLLLTGTAECLPPYIHVIDKFTTFKFSILLLDISLAEPSNTHQYLDIFLLIISFIIIVLLLIFCPLFHSVSRHEHFLFSTSVFPNPKTPAPSPMGLNKSPLADLITCYFIKILEGEFPAPAGEGSRDQQMQRLGDSHLHCETTWTKRLGFFPYIRF